MDHQNSTLVICVALIAIGCIGLAKPVFEQYTPASQNTLDEIRTGVDHGWIHEDSVWGRMSYDGVLSKWDARQLTRQIKARQAYCDAFACEGYPISHPIEPNRVPLRNKTDPGPRL